MVDNSSKVPDAWCLDCRAAATGGCWREHEVLNARAALRRQVRGALTQAAAQLEGLPDQCEEAQVMQALVLLNAESCALTLRPGAQELTGIVSSADDPLTKAMWVTVVAKAALVQGPGAADGPSAPRGSTAVEEWGAVRETKADSASSTSGQEENKELVKPFVGNRASVNCAWTKNIFQTDITLQRHAHRLQELRLEEPSEDALRTVHTMPRLRRLALDGGFAPRSPMVLPALPPGHSGLQWLRVCAPLHRVTLQSLLKAHSHSLEVLLLRVVTEDSLYNDLHTLLKQCGLRTLRRLVLQRTATGYCKRSACEKQISELRRELPGVTVFCEKCMPLGWTDF